MTSSAGITTVAVYRDDLEWLKRKQVEWAAARGARIHLYDVIRELIKAIETPENGA